MAGHLCSALLTLGGLQGPSSSSEIRGVASKQPPTDLGHVLTWAVTNGSQLLGLAFFYTHSDRLRFDRRLVLNSLSQASSGTGEWGGGTRGGRCVSALLNAS